MAKTHKVTFQRRGVTIECAEDEYILEKAEQAGMRLTYDCRSGTCVTCKVRQLDAEMDQDMSFALVDD